MIAFRVSHAWTLDRDMSRLLRDELSDIVAPLSVLSAGDKDHPNFTDRVAQSIPGACLRVRDSLMFILLPTSTPLSE